MDPDEKYTCEPLPDDDFCETMARLKRQNAEMRQMAGPVNARIREWLAQNRGTPQLDFEIETIWMPNPDCGECHDRVYLGAIRNFERDCRDFPDITESVAIHNCGKGRACKTVIRIVEKRRGGWSGA